MTDDKMLERIRALLAKAEDVAGTPEADAYNEKVAELVAKYGIDQALLAEKAPELNVPGDKIIVVDAPYAHGKAELCSWVAQALRCRVVRRTAGTTRTRVELHIFGMESDLERFDLLYTSLLIQASTGMMKAPVPSWEHGRAYRNSWLRGFATEVFNRLIAAERHAERTAETGTPGTALVLADRSALVQAREHEVYPHLRTGGGRKVDSWSSGFGHGREAGRKADLNQTRLAPNRKALA